MLWGSHSQLWLTPWCVAMCRDIKKMDYAKKHLTNTITALRRLAMLTAAVAGEDEGGRAGVMPCMACSRLGL